MFGKQELDLDRVCLSALQLTARGPEPQEKTRVLVYFRRRSIILSTDVASLLLRPKVLSECSHICLIANALPSESLVFQKTYISAHKVYQLIHSLVA